MRMKMMPSVVRWGLVVLLAVTAPVALSACRVGDPASGGTASTTRASDVGAWVGQVANTQAHPERETSLTFWSAVVNVLHLAGAFEGDVPFADDDVITLQNITWMCDEVYLPLERAPAPPSELADLVERTITAAHALEASGSVEDAREFAATLEGWIDYL